jgi:hypothetical protein
VIGKRIQRIAVLIFWQRLAQIRMKWSVREQLPYCSIKVQRNPVGPTPLIETTELLRSKTVNSVSVTDLTGQAFLTLPNPFYLFDPLFDVRYRLQFRARRLPEGVEFVLDESLHVLARENLIEYNASPIFALDLRDVDAPPSWPRIC